jgi:hypothetical protein
MKTKILQSATLILLIIILSSSFVKAVTITSTTTGGDWGVTTTWIGGVVPGVTNDVVIATTGTGAVTTSSTSTLYCFSLTINSGSILTMYSPFTITTTSSISGTINFGSTNSTARTMTFIGDVTLNSGAVWNETTTGAAALFSFGGNFTNNATTFTAQPTNHIFTGTSMTIGGTTENVMPSITLNGTTTNSGTLTVSTTLNGTGTLTNTGNLNITVGSPGVNLTLNASSVGNTVTYNRNVAQTGISATTTNPTTYYNLTLSGAGSKTFGIITVNNVLSMEGTATLLINNSFTYGPNATLQYNTATARTVSSVEWILTFAATGGVIITNTGAITLNAMKVLSAGVPLTINAGATLMVPDGDPLTVGGTLSSASGLVIQDGGSVIYAAGTPSGTAERNVTHALNHFLSSPVTSTTFGSVFPINQMLIWAQQYVESSGTWQNLLDANSLTPGIGYSMWVDASIGTQTAMFTGTFNSDGVTVTLSDVNSSGDPNKVAWNLLGNPYTSALDWDIGSWHGNVQGSVYIWSSSQYISWNGSTGGISGGVIPAQSGFFVKANGNGLPMTIPWAARVHSVKALYKDAVPDVLHLGIEGNSYRDDTYIQFAPGTTAGFDSQGDAYKLWGITDAPQLYSIIPGDVLSINALPSIEANPDVSLGLKVGKDTTYTITADGIESFSGDVPMRLDDLKLGISTDLRVTPQYTFTAAPGDAENRFIMRFHSSSGVVEPTLTDLLIYGSHENIVVNNAGNYTGTINVYDAIGKSLVSQSLQPGISKITQLPDGIYIVKAVIGKTSISRKVVLY